ncbi:putative ankyrin repeat protein RF_0381 [Penaeus chinensis]|uniref:putative ankyrin repeat protein RF_0381 n=1 Tax=Penaeus chinensis TaxID=139456 RepID=UPI001FB7E219|nr:putative ankyrin repeat protein RF_0381 [Penaeus chinensis]
MGCGLSSEAAAALPVPSSPDEALELAMKHGDIQALEKALETHANVNKKVKDEHGTECTILHMAARVGNGEAIKMILKAGADIRAVDSNGQTVLHWAALHDKPDAVVELVQGGLPVDTPGSNGETALKSALLKKANSALAKLIELGASVQDPDKNGLEAPLVTAAKNDNVTAVLLLLKA